MAEKNELVCCENECCGCKACITVCSKQAISFIDNGLSLNCIIDKEKCINCGLCKKVCQNNNELLFNEPISFKEGWSTDSNTRNNSASGGFASSAISFYLKNNWSVFSCRFLNSKLVYAKCNTIEEILFFAGSKYLKSDPGNVYSQISAELRKGINVLFIGLPCHIAGLLTYLGHKYDNLLTIDLICHGTPSNLLFNDYFNWKNGDINCLDSFKFRTKNSFLTSLDNIRKYPFWNKPFLDGITYTENCYSCRFARKSRVSDISIGDSWGSTLDANEKKKGISLILINSKKGQQLIDNLLFATSDVKIKRAIAFNGQLNHPFIKPKKRDTFANNYRKGKDYIKAIKRTCGFQIVLYEIKHCFIFDFLRKK